MTALRWTIPACAFAVTACVTPEPSHLRLINLVEGARGVTVRLCGRSDGCRTMAMARDTMTPVFAVRPGAYDIAVLIDGEMVDRFTYGIGNGDHYGLVLYGIAATPIHVGWSTRIARLLGGSDRPRTLHGQLAHRMVMMHPGDAAAHATVRLANLAPGLTTVSGAIATGGTRDPVSRSQL